MATEGKETSADDVFQLMVLQSKIILTPADLADIARGTSAIEDKLHERLTSDMAGRTTEHGLIKRDGVELVGRSIGRVHSDGNVEYQTTYRALVCAPQPGQRIRCRVQGKTIAGIRASLELEDLTPAESPMVIYIPNRFDEDAEAERGAYEGAEVDHVLTAEILNFRQQLGKETLSVVARIVVDS